MAIVFPVLILIVFGLVEYVNCEFIRQGIAEATYEGCRQGIVRGATAEECKDATEHKLRMLGITQGTITVDMTDTEVRIQADIPITGNSFGITNFIGVPEIVGSFDLQREADAIGSTADGSLIADVGWIMEGASTPV